MSRTEIRIQQWIIRLLFLSLLLLYAVASRSDDKFIPIPRNQAWNGIVELIPKSHDSFEKIGKFLKLEQRNVHLQQLDAGILKNLDDAIQENDEMGKRLKEIRKEITKDYSSVPTRH